VKSEAFPNSVSQAIASIRPIRGASAWANYVLGAARIILEAWPRRGGLRIHVGGDLPVGVGLASSAALCVATLRALSAVAGRRSSPAAISAWARQVENEFVGVPVGPLDPLSCATSRRRQFTMLNFAETPRFERVRIPRDWQLLVFDTGSQRILRASGYARRRDECAAAAKTLGVSMLGELTSAQLDRGARRLSPVLRRRARHVVGESARVDAAMAILREPRDAAAIGALMNSSQRSSRDDFENSHPAIDAAVARLRRLPGVAGVRLTGGGFGGAVIAWVRRDEVRGVLAQLARGGAGSPRLLDIV
jgi:galactokinase